MKHKDIVNTPHNHFFKHILSDKRVVRQFIELYLPKKIYQYIDLSSLELQPVSFVDSELKKRESDLVYQAKVGDSLGYFYLLFEHQSTPDLTMPMRCARYVSLIQERHLKEDKSDKIPLVYPVVFYNGKSKYDYPTDVREMLDAPKALINDFRMGRFLLIDMHDIKDDELKTSSWLGLSLFAMKHVYDLELKSVINSIITSLEILNEQVNETEFLSRQTPLLCYIMSSYRSLDMEDFMQSLEGSKSDAIRREGLTVAQQLEQQGLQKGLQKGLKKGLQQGQQAAQSSIVRHMLRSGLSAERISALTNVPLSQVEAIVAEEAVE